MNISILAFTLATAVNVTSCGCSGTGIEGDTGIDGDAPTGDPSWDPVIDSMGEPGWRESTEPWCDPPLGSFYGFDVWSDSRGVFVLGAQFYYPPEGGETTALHIQFNDGTGWRYFLEEEPGLAECEAGVSSCGLRGITGVDGGVMFGWGGYNVVTIREGEVVRRFADEFNDLFAINDNLAYATPNSDPRLHWWDGSDWGPFPGEALPYSVNKLWANESCIFGAGFEGIVLSWTGEGWNVEDTRTTDGVSAICGFDCNDVWFGTESGQIHHYTPATGWERLDAPVLGAYGETEIEGMWGHDGVLFFHSRHQLTMWDGSGFRVLGYWPATSESSGIEIMAIWGNSPTELFVAVIDEDHSSPECGDWYVMWWDGSEFHWF